MFEVKRTHNTHTHPHRFTQSVASKVQKAKTKILPRSEVHTVTVILYD